MLSGRVRILNFDDSVVKQTGLLQRFNPIVVDLSAIGASCRLWSNRKDAEAIRKSLRPEHQNSATFLGSGDFHHISSILIEQFVEPISVIVFDFHPDWDILPPRLGCGSWVSNILRRNNVKKVILCGVSSEDISTIRIQTGNLISLKNNRVEIYPYSHKPTLTWLKKIPDNLSLQVRRGIFYNRIYWQELKNRNLPDFFSGIIGRLETRKVYVSIDKDCLKSDYALTNWEIGCLELSDLLEMLRLIKERLDIAGLDIVGDYSPPETKGKIKPLFSKLDHPQNYSAYLQTESRINSVNQQTNMKIIELLSE